MATNRNTLKSWFKTLLKPTEAQFAALIDSMFHPDEDTLTMDKVEGLDTALQNLGNKDSLTSDVVATGVKTDLGISDGTKFAQGLSVTDAFKQLLRRAVHPTYVSPTLDITLNPSGTVEVGTVVYQNISVNYQINDSGAIGDAFVYRNGTRIFTDTGGDPLMYTDTYTFGEEDVEWGVTVEYSAGDVKQNNFGEDDPLGQIQDGAVSDYKTLAAKYRLFALTAASEPSTVDSTYIRTNNAIGTKYKGTNSYSLDVSDSKYVAIVCPPGVTLDTANTKNPDTNEKVFDGITPTSLTINCAGTATATYSIYELNTSSAWASGTKFNVELN